MAVARETIVLALKDLLQLEEFTVENLSEVGRYDFRFFATQDVKKIRIFLSKLKEDTGEHQQLVSRLIARLEGKEERHDLKS